jgi:hypothetical protein
VSALTVLARTSFVALAGAAMAVGMSRDTDVSLVGELRTVERVFLERGDELLIFHPIRII